MREHLLGYLLGALEPTEHDSVAARLNADAKLQAEFVCLREKLDLLAADAEPYEPPAGLALRTCGYVAARAATGSSASSAGAPSAAGSLAGRPFGTGSSAGVPSAAGSLAGRPFGTGSSAGRTAVASPASAWRLQDLIVAGGIAVAACMLVFPAIAASRFDARRDACQNNLRSLGMALNQYSDAYGGFFPVVPSEGPLAVAGMYAPTLSRLGYLESPSWLICPASAAARSVVPGSAAAGSVVPGSVVAGSVVPGSVVPGSVVAGNGGEFKVPTFAELEAAGPRELAELQQRMGGDYGFLFGYYQDGVYRGHKHRGRENFALMADAPQKEQPGCRSANHESRGQNVLFDDFHVSFLTNCCLADHGDHIYHNAHGYIGAGVNADDSVIAQSGARVVWFTIELGQ
ncbi:MAG TPA: DUF1559 domain-containing protein [Pirellulales bacterium]|nr:DUF1559 domain-containing protein [Pirellulales bacterium]